HSLADLRHLPPFPTRRSSDLARRDIEKMKMEWLDALERERQESLQSFRENLSRAVFAVAKQGLKELANADLEARIAEVFVERLQDRKSTRLNSSHVKSSYAVF